MSIRDLKDPKGEVVRVGIRGAPGIIDNDTAGSGGVAGSWLWGAMKMHTVISEGRSTRSAICDVRCFARRYHVCKIGFHLTEQPIWRTRPMDEPKKSTPSAADIGSEAHTGIPKAGNVTPGTTPNAADLTENELEDVVGGFVYAKVKVTYSSDRSGISGSLLNTSATVHPSTGS
jgi:hypothetical protein